MRYYYKDKNSDFYNPNVIDNPVVWIFASFLISVVAVIAMIKGYRSSLIVNIAVFSTIVFLIVTGYQVYQAKKYLKTFHNFVSYLFNYDIVQALNTSMLNSKSSAGMVNKSYRVLPKIWIWKCSSMPEYKIKIEKLAGTYADDLDKIAELVSSAVGDKFRITSKSVAQDESWFDFVVSPVNRDLLFVPRSITDLLQPPYNVKLQNGLKINFGKLPHLCVFGKTSAGKSTVLWVIILQIISNSELYFIDIKQEFSILDSFYPRNRFATNADAVLQVLQKVADILDERKLIVQKEAKRRGVIGVTGSDGKTTTTTLIDLVLRANGYKTFLGGNIGTPLFTKIKDMQEKDIVVLELSSFQLMNMPVSPDISIITNVTPNHLDKHKDLNEYIEAKLNIFKNSPGILVLNKDNEVTKNIKSTREIRYFSRYSKTNAFYLEDNYICFNNKQVFNTKNLNIRGIHNYENICACMSAIYDMVDLDKSFKAISEFKGVEHRLEFVREINNVKWYNDSVSSSPTRTIAGLNSYSEDIVLIAGGYDKNLDYTPIAKPILNKVTKLILFGATKDKIEKAVLDNKTNESIQIYTCKTLEEVVAKAKEVATPKEIVLFSPASASFDMFKNFADRGIQFKNLVNKL